MGNIRRRRILMRSSALAGALSLAVAGAAFAADPRIVAFDMPEQSLGESLRDFYRASGEQIVFSESIVAGRKSPPLKGDYTPDQALALLLDGTDLTARRSTTGVVMIEAPQSGSAAGDGAEVEALIVTAQKREEDIQDVPIAISAFTQEDLTRSQVAGGADLMTQVPNMTFTKTNFSGYSIQIRGIGTQAISATTDPAVAVAFNNTPFIRNHFFEQEFYDLARVEVLRGPQGTLYGRNATAGVVNLISAKPSFQFEARLSADVANYSSTRLEGMLNLPLVEDKAAIRFAGAWTKRDGFVTNLITGEQTDGRNLWSGRVSLRLEPVDWMSVNLIYEHFSEDDDRLRSGKQLCHTDPGPLTIAGISVPQNVGYYPSIPGPAWYSQGCKAASLYAPESFETPNGYSLPYYGPAQNLGSPVYNELNPYLNAIQSRDLREIETHLTPEYDVRTDTVELQLQFDMGPSMTLSGETGFSHDYLFSFSDYNRFATTPGVFVPGGSMGGDEFDVVSLEGVFCDPQLGCSDRLAAGDLDTARSWQFAQEFRLSSDFEGVLNFNAGVNFLRYKTEEKYYVFINSLTAYSAAYTSKDGQVWIPGVSDLSRDCLQGQQVPGYAWRRPRGEIYGYGCITVDPNDIHNLNDQGRNYFLSKNPYDLTSYSAFGELYYKINPDLKLTAGFRWTVDRKVAPQIPSWLFTSGTYGLATRKVLDQEWGEPTGRLALDWKPELSFTDDTLLYASYVRGYKAGGANPPPTASTPNDPSQTSKHLGESTGHPEVFEPEFVNAYEIGAKNTLLNGTLTANLNGFYYDYRGYQLSQIVNRAAVNLNFDAQIWGAELEVDWRPLENLHLALKGGYENTRLADGSRNIDLIDRTAGDPNYVVMRPFPSEPANCIAPLAYAAYGGELQLPWCADFFLSDPSIGLGAGKFDIADVPNHGLGLFKDISGNELPNAPHWTGTISADYTVPVGDWLATMHGDFYYQAESWARVFNTPGYDKLKALTNINLAAIFTNEQAGWRVMAYVKNVLDSDHITGAFLNSDDTGLTTNVFLIEPRLYGLRVTKEWKGGGWWPGQNHELGAPYPFRLEVEGYGGRFDQDHQILQPAATELFPASFPFPFEPQGDIDWGTGGGAKFTYAPDQSLWSYSVAARYGRAGGKALAHSEQILDQEWCIINDKYCENLTLTELQNFTDTEATNEEAHAIADFMIGRDFGLGSADARSGSSTFSFGLERVQLKSSSTAKLHGRPDLYYPPNFYTMENREIIYHPSFEHAFQARYRADREFEGAGPVVQWDAYLPLKGNQDDAGRLDGEISLGAGILFGKQRTAINGEVSSQYYRTDKYTPTAVREDTPVIHNRSRSTNVPVVRASLGLAYSLGGVKVSGGYRGERYFKAIDAGIEERKTYDRDLHGPYFKVSVGF